MNRIASIDIFRAVTMCLMIFVNDFFTLKDVPKWLLHTDMYEDGMGFSDTIFPMFLVIVGMSIPYAISARKKKGDDSISVLKHIGERTLALVLMGFLLVNYENLKANTLPFTKSWVGLCVVTCFFLIWNAYPKNWKPAMYLKLLGVFGLMGFVSLFPGGFMGLKPYWWGILGLIGWSYFWAALAYFWAENSISKLLIATVFFLLFSLASFGGLLDFLAPVKKYVWMVESGGLPFLVMLGILASVLYQNQTFKNYTLALVIIGVCLVGLGFMLRPYWGISKMLATPAWICICGGISYGIFALLHYGVDVKQKVQWATILQPAGVATLTCYLLPYYWYAVRSLTELKLPGFALEYPLGLLMSMGVAICIIQITGVLIKLGIKLKV
jgi:predicted acyltransferase